MSYRFWAGSLMHRMVEQEAMRSRMRYELNQDVHNLVLDYDKISDAERHPSYWLRHKMQIANHLSDRDMDKTKYFVDHLETQIQQYARDNDILYKFFVDAVYDAEWDPKLKSRTMDFMHHAFSFWDRDLMLVVEMDLQSKQVIVIVNDVDANFVSRITEVTSGDVQVVEEHLRATFRNAG